LDKILTVVPNHKLSGSEIVSLTKHAFHAGWVHAVNYNPKGTDPAGGMIVLRGAGSKEIRRLSSRFMGMMMGSNVTHKGVPKDGRALIVVPHTAADTLKIPGSEGWVWWAEKDDLVVGFTYPTSADAIIACLDGKTSSALEHQQVQELAKPEGKFQPVCVAF